MLISVILDLLKLVFVGTLIKLCADELARSMQKESASYKIDGLSMIILDLALCLLPKSARNMYYDDWFVFLCEQKSSWSRFINAVGLCWAAVAILAYTFDPARCAKRAMDIAVCVVAVAALSPLLAMVALCLRITGHPVFVRWAYAGRGGKTFNKVNFTAPKGSLFGKWLCYVGVDQIPSAFNILKGEMSLIGPTVMPQHMFDGLPSPLKEHSRFSVTPGLVGLAFMNGVGSSWKDAAINTRRMTYDSQYVSQWSLALDLQILSSFMRVKFWAPSESEQE